MQRRTSTRHASIGGHDGGASVPGRGAARWLREHTLADVLAARSDAARGGPPAGVPMGAAPATVLDAFRSHGVHNLLVDNAHWLRDRAALCALRERAWGSVWSGLVRADAPVGQDTPLEAIIGGWAACARTTRGWLPPVLVRLSTHQGSEEPLRVVTAADVLRYALLHRRALAGVLDAGVSALGGAPADGPRVVSAKADVRTVLRLLCAGDADAVGVLDGGTLVASLSVRRALSLVAEGRVSGIAMGDGTADTKVDGRAASLCGAEPAEQAPEPMVTARELAAPPVAAAASVSSVGAALGRMLRAKSHCAWLVDDFGRAHAVVVLADVVVYLHGAIE